MDLLELTVIVHGMDQGVVMKMVEEMVEEVAMVEQDGLDQIIIQLWMDPMEMEVEMEMDLVKVKVKVEALGVLDVQEVQEVQEVLSGVWEAMDHQVLMKNVLGMALEGVMEMGEGEKGGYGGGNGGGDGNGGGGRGPVGGIGGVGGTGSSSPDSRCKLFLE